MSSRVNQKERTRQAIVAATRELIRAGGEVTMPAVAKSALVSEATAYRYFPDLASLLREALTGVWPSPETALAPVAGMVSASARRHQGRPLRCQSSGAPRIESVFFVRVGSHQL